MVRFWTFVSIGARLDVSWLVSHIFYAWLCAWITNFYVLWNEAGTNHWRTFVSLFRSCLVVPTKSNKKVTAHHMCVRDATMRRLWKQRVECGLSYVGFLWYVHINHERKKRSNLFWLWRFHSNLAISGYVAFVSGKCLGMAISLCQLEECLQKCDDPCVLYMTHGSVMSPLLLLFYYTVDLCIWNLQVMLWNHEQSTFVQMGSQNCEAPCTKCWS